MTRIRKAVFPAAGLGTRFLPATKAQPKEMLPLVDKPIIQYGVEEALASGVDNILLVTGRGKNAIEDHFDVSVELETFLEARGKHEMLAEVRKISNLINFAYVRQGEPLGLGHAVLVTRELVGAEPFAVILSDDVIDATPPALLQMINVFDKVNGPVLCVERVPREDISSYGVIAYQPDASLPKGVYRVTDLVEKPPRDQAPSDLAIIGRYILTPDIFESLEETAEGSDGRDSADQRAAPPAAVASDLCVRSPGRPPRHRQQAGVSQGRDVLRAQEPGTVGTLHGLSADGAQIDSRLDARGSRKRARTDVFVSVVCAIRRGAPARPARVPPAARDGLGQSLLAGVAVVAVVDLESGFEFFESLESFESFAPFESLVSLADSLLAVPLSASAFPLSLSFRA